ncbi:MAG TPA: hypothetical protein VF157_13515 [Chloroflexota bacterium]
MRRLAFTLALLLAGCGPADMAAPLRLPGAPESSPAALAASATPTPAIDGRIAFSKGHDLWLFQGATASQLTTTGAVQDPAWSPDGSLLAFDRAGKNSADLLILSYPDGHVQQLTSNGSAVVDSNFWDMQPAWSPDGKFLVFASDRGRTRTGTLDLAVWRMALADRVRSQLSGANVYTGGVDRPSVRPGDGFGVLYTSWTYLPTYQDAYGQLVLLDSPSGKSWLLSERGETAMQGSWSPDGVRIAFIRRVGSKDQVWLAPVPFLLGADTDVLAQATLVADGVNAHPVWSSRGDSIAYIGLRDGSFDLWVQPLTPALGPDGPPRQLTHGLHVDADSSISWAA